MSLIPFSPRLVLPLMIFLGVSIVGVRVGDVWDTLTTGKLFSPVQKVEAANDKAGEKKPEAPASSSTTASTKPDEKAPTGKPAEKTVEKPAEKSAEKPPEKPAPAGSGSSSPESDLYKQLAGRREQLDKRAADLDEREALALVTEQRVDQKIKEMEVLRNQLQALVGQAGAAQQAQIENLVKIYEIMKPKEAAKIFEALELPVLLGVIQKMKPARTAAVMAEMNPEKAKEITVALTRQDQLPQVK